MLILALKIGQRLYISPAVGNRLIVEVIDLTTNCFGHVRVRLEIKADLSKKNRQTASSIKCSKQVQESKEYLAQGCIEREICND